MRLQLIQALRAFAAYLVLLYHIRYMELGGAEEMGTGEMPLVSLPFTNGWAGVDLFFVISGFIMVYVTFSRPATLSTVKDFLLARVFRIYPAWWLFSGIMALFFLIRYGVPYDAEAVSQLNNSPINHIIRSIFLLPQINFPILGVGWTLIHEIWFYIVFAGLLLLPRKTLWVWLLVWALLVTAGALMGFSMPYSENYLTLAASPMTLEFIAGAFVGLLAAKGVTRFALPAAIIGAIGLLAVLFLHPTPTPFTLEWGRVLFLTLPSALLLYGAFGLEPYVKGKTLNVFSRLGDWSFALYLGHHFTIAAIREIGYILAAKGEPLLGLETGSLNFLRLGAPGILDNLLYIPIAIILPTIIAALAYYFFEQPVLKFLNSRFRKRQPNKEKRDMLETTAP